MGDDFGPAQRHLVEIEAVHGRAGMLHVRSRSSLSAHGRLHGRKDAAASPDRSEGTRNDARGRQQPTARCGRCARSMTAVLFATSSGRRPIHLDDAAVGGCVASRPVPPSPTPGWWGERALGGRVLLHNGFVVRAFEIACCSAPSAAGLDSLLWTAGRTAGGVRYQLDLLTDVSGYFTLYIRILPTVRHTLGVRFDTNIGRKLLPRRFQH